METRIHQLRMLLSESKQGDVYAGLNDCLNFLENDLRRLTQIEAEEEFDAILFVTAYLKKYRHSTGVKNLVKKNPPEFHKDIEVFLHKLKSLQGSPSDEMYRQLIDWGFYVQKH